MDQHDDFGPDHTSSVDELLADYLRRVEAGEAVDREAFLRQHPAAADALRSYFDGADLVERRAGSESGSNRRRADDATVRHSLGSAETIAPRGLADSWELPTGPFGTLPAAFGRYRVEKAIGRGAMGSVYLARDTQLDRPVALKVPRLSGHEDAQVLDRFLREARAAANLTHPNICRVFDVGVEAGVWFIAMEFVDGRPLADFIVPGHQHEEKRCANVLRKLASALDEAHGKGIIHRDLKPANILINQRGEPILMDFGLARLADTSQDGRATRSGMILGSPAYMSPEQANGEIDRIGPPSDIYSLGVLLFELLTGQLPFQGSVLTILSQIATKDPPLPSSLRPGLDLRLEALCLKMLAKPRERRFGSMSEVERELTTWLASAPAVAASSSPSREPSGPGSSREMPSVTFASADQGTDAPRSPASGKSASARDSIGGLLPAADKSAAAKKSATVTADDVAKQKQRLQKLLAEHNLAAAVPALEKLAQQTNPVFKEAAAWAKSELPAARERQRKLHDQNVAACKKAQTLLEKQDYSGAAAVLDQIPAGARSADAAQLLAKASELYDECAGLLNDIEEAIRRQKYDRLLPLVKRYLKLKPDSPKLERLARDLAANRPARAVAKYKDSRRYLDVAGRLVEPKEVALSALGILALFTAVTIGLRSYLANSRPAGNTWTPPQVRSGSGGASAPVSGVPGKAVVGDQAFHRPALAGIDQRPLTISTHGLPIPALLESETMRPFQQLTAWRQEGAFGRIRGAGEMSFPLLAVSEFAIELDLTFENQDKDGLFIDLRSDRLADEWVRFRVIWDEQKQKVARQLYWFKEATFRQPVQHESEAGKRLELTLLVGNNNQQLFGEGEEQPLVQIVRTQAFHPQIQSYAGTDVTIHRFLIRALTDDERSRLMLPKSTGPVPALWTEMAQGSLFPLHPGAEYTYEIWTGNQLTGEGKATVGRDPVHVGGYNCREWSWSANVQNGNKQHFHVDHESGIARMMQQSVNGAQDPPLPLYPLNDRQRSWEWSGRVRDVPSKATFTLDGPKSVTVPMGTFDAYVSKTDYRDVPGNFSHVQEDTLVPGIGLVRSMVWNGGNLTSDFRLKSVSGIPRRAGANSPESPPSGLVLVVLSPKREEPIWLIRTGETGGHEWEYLSVRKALAAAGWEKPNYPRQFKKGSGPFGNGQAQGVRERTTWGSNHIYLRTTVDLPSLDRRRLVLRHIHDDDAWVYVNGQVLDLLPDNGHSYLWGYSLSYRDVRIAKSQHPKFRKGTNVISVHCQQNSGAQIIDIGLRVEAE